jgi:hypothetical protein
MLARLPVSLRRLVHAGKRNKHEPQPVEHLARVASVETTQVIMPGSGNAVDEYQWKYPASLPMVCRIAVQLAEGYRHVQA